LPPPSLTFPPVHAATGWPRFPLPGLGPRGIVQFATPGAHEVGVFGAPPPELPVEFESEEVPLVPPLPLVDVVRADPVLVPVVKLLCPLPEFEVGGQLSALSCPAVHGAWCPELAAPEFPEEFVSEEAPPVLPLPLVDVVMPVPAELVVDPVLPTDIVDCVPLRPVTGMIVCPPV